MEKGVDELKSIANVLRRDVLISTSSAGSGHPTSCLSCAEIIATLFFKEMKWDVNNSQNKDNDEFILSKGHAAPILYSVLKRAGAIKDDLNGLRKVNSRLEGHPIPYSDSHIKVATGSLGQGLSVGVGMALAGKLEKRKFRTFVLLGDSEMAEGSNYEAMEIAAHYKLDNLIAIVDVNRLGQRGETLEGWDLDNYKKKFESFGWNVAEVNGHKVEELIKAFEKAKRNKGRPFVILAKTIKGKGVSFLENKNGWHGRALDEKELAKALKEIKEVEMPSVMIEKAHEVKVNEYKNKKIIFTKYKKTDVVATREAYGNALALMAAAEKNVIAVDGEVSNSTKSENVKKKSSAQFIEAYIAEQNMIGMALGLSKKGFHVFASTFAAFLTRAHDQIRMSAYSKGNFTICGSHSGVSIGKDGVSQMGLEDIGMFRALPNSIIFYPSDAVSTEKLLFECKNLSGIKYIRTTRGKTPILYNENEKFEVGDFKVLKETTKDAAVVIGAGITVHEALKAHDELKKKKKNVAVIDLYCIKPFDRKKFIDFVKEHGNKVIVVEDHYEAGGIGEMISKVLEGTGIGMKHLCIRGIPHSGKPEELLEKYGIDAKVIEKNV
ncbi:MAG: transketolase [Nanoarchaeota archaeon]